MWEVDYPAEGETCQGQQADSSCKSIYLPKCVDRNVYCNPFTFPANSSASKSLVDNNYLKVGSSIKFTCPIDFWYFNYSVPQNLVSYYYSHNIKNTTVICNEYG